MTQIKKNVKTVFNSFTSVKIFYPPLGHIAQNTSAETLFKHNAQIDGESMQELMSHLALC